MRTSGGSHRNPAPGELVIAEGVESALADRTAIDWERAYLHCRTTEVTGGAEVHLPLARDSEVALVVDFDVVTAAGRLGWAWEPDGPDWPALVSGSFPLEHLVANLTRELSRRLRVRGRAALVTEVLSDSGSWVPLRNFVPRGGGPARETTLAAWNDSTEH